MSLDGQPDSAQRAPFSWSESVLSTRTLSSSDAGVLPAGKPSASLQQVSTPQTAMAVDSDSGMDEALDEEGVEAGQRKGLSDGIGDSSFFQLPRELRDRVYSLCLTAQHSLPVEWPLKWKTCALQPQLLRTCKSVYAEAASLLYTSNNLTFHHPSDANMFVRAVASPLLGQQVASLSLHIKAQDTRLWMAYVSSRDPHRSLMADFPRLRELNVRFRSNKWQHALPPETNLKMWHEDSRLDEIIDGLRSIFRPVRPTDQRVETDASSPARSFFGRTGWPSSRRHASPEHKDRPDSSRAQPTPAPTIKLVCACRINAAHFVYLSSETPPPAVAAAAAGGAHPLPLPPTPDTPPSPVHEGEGFRGFSAADLRQNVHRLSDPELGAAHVARTPFADKGGILLALEVHCLDPRRDPPERNG